VSPYLSVRKKNSTGKMCCRNYFPCASASWEWERLCDVIHGLQHRLGKSHRATLACFSVGVLYAFAVDNGFNPVWSESCEFDIINPSMALLRFVVQDVDMFGDPNFLGQATFPLLCIRPGWQAPIIHSWSLVLPFLCITCIFVFLMLEWLRVFF